jgi:hypothetical protein
VDGSIHAKRYFDKRDIDESIESPFVERVCNPFPAINRDDALAKLREVFYGNT